MTDSALYTRKKARFSRMLTVYGRKPALEALRDESLGCHALHLADNNREGGIIAELTASGNEPARDAFGHVLLDAVNPGKWFGAQFAKKLGAEKVLVQKSGYFARSAPANAEDFQLIDTCVLKAVECAKNGVTGTSRLSTRASGLSWKTQACSSHATSSTSIVRNSAYCDHARACPL